MPMDAAEHSAVRMAHSMPEDVPQLAFQNAAFAIMHMDKTGEPTPLTAEDRWTLLVALREYVPSVGAYIDGA